MVPVPGLEAIVKKEIIVLAAIKRQFETVDSKVMSETSQFVKL